MESCSALQSLEIVFLVGRMLIDDEQIPVQLGNDEAQIELAHSFHLSCSTENGFLKNLQFNYALGRVNFHEFSKFQDPV